MPDGMQEEKPDFLAKSGVVSAYDDTRDKTAQKTLQNASHEKRDLIFLAPLLCRHRIFKPQHSNSMASPKQKEEVNDPYRANPFWRLGIHRFFLRRTISGEMGEQPLYGSTHTWTGLLGLLHEHGTAGELLHTLVRQGRRGITPSSSPETDKPISQVKMIISIKEQ